ncbi:hypothetical protein [Clostridium sp.]|uniref:hypothetical protein n=1 Tax=Clostridium sp. TaxID=1506 RepID=UPI00399311AB
MKKKLLSLVLAGAMVATTSVSAFAANVTGPDNVDGSSQIEITGKVLNSSNVDPVGKFNVTIPTTASFTVRADGKFVAPEAITVRNDGDQNIDVFAESFVDTNPGAGIKVVAENTLKDIDRTNVSLKIFGNMGTVFLGSEEGSHKGLYSNSSLTEHTGTFQIANVPSRESRDLTLSGMAGGNSGNLEESVAQNGVSNNFTLTLKIKKAAK